MASFNNKALSILLQPFRTRKPNRQFNPTNPIHKKEEIEEVKVEIFSYNDNELQHTKSSNIQDCLTSLPKGKITWINIDGLKKDDITSVAQHFNIHQLLVEDILSKGQRAKADNMDEQLYCLLPMLKYNPNTGMIDVEQLSIIVGNGYIISFQEEPESDPFDNVRNKLQNNNINLRKKGADYLCYALIDAVVDQYFNVLDFLVSRLEKLEDEVVLTNEKNSLLKITLLRKEIMAVKRLIGPVREVVNYFLNTDNTIIYKGNRKYFKDVYDHILLAIEYTENYRDMITNLQDLNMNKVDMKLNEVMKILTVVTTLLAPATVIGGVFGMNFDKIPFSNSPNGFYIAVSIMLGISFLMLVYFKMKKWF